MHKHISPAVYLNLSLLLLVFGSVQAAGQAWKLTWSDEFNGARGTAVDANKWTAETGGSGWGNQELEYYTDSLDNAHLDGRGALVIVASTAPPGTSLKCWYGPCRYTSARLISKGKFSQAYGRFEARIRLTEGQGLWPAFWLLGNDIDRAGWPACGEIDIMENIGVPDIVRGTIYGPGYSASGGLGADYNLPEGRFADNFHIFAVEWEPKAIRWYVDDKLYETRTPSDLPAGTRWVYDHPFFILLNVAVGGTWPGSPDAKTAFPQTMAVDYVRVYSR
jgi:beta-glucanase (GH16 family)